MYDSTKDTMTHKENIKKVMSVIIKELENRMEHHDDSKLESPEKEAYDKYIPLLKDAEYGSLEYYEIKRKMAKECLDHHYKVNRHHPEHYENSDISNMTIVDLVEMFCDHLAASMVSDSTYEKGEKVNKGRYHYSNQVFEIFMNTYDEFFK